VVCNVPSKLRGRAVTEMLPRALNCCHAAGIFQFSLSIFLLCILQKVLQCRAFVRSCKNFLPRAAAGPRSCKKIRGNVGDTLTALQERYVLYLDEFDSSKY
jgi:hypothetical protein